MTGPRRLVRLGSRLPPPPPEVKMEEWGKKVKMLEKKCWNNCPQSFPRFQHFIKILKKF
jgi:hypothetical protein